MLPTQYLKRTWFWLGMGTGALALTGLMAWYWKTRPHGPLIQPVQIDFSFMRHPTAAAPQAAPAVPATPAEAARAVVAAAQTPAMEAQPAAAPAADDLTVLIGIGPRIAAVLQAAGVNSFAQLAQADPAWLRATLQTHNLRLVDPESWPEQARLAAAGKLDEMKAYAARRRTARGGQ